MEFLAAAVGPVCLCGVFFALQSTVRQDHPLRAPQSYPCASHTLREQGTASTGSSAAVGRWRCGTMRCGLCEENKGLRATGSRCAGGWALSVPPCVPGQGPREASVEFILLGALLSCGAAKQGWGGRMQPAGWQLALVLRTPHLEVKRYGVISTERIALFWVSSSVLKTERTILLVWVAQLNSIYYSLLYITYGQQRIWHRTKC